jgi:hypothetical protein
LYAAVRTAHEARQDRRGHPVTGAVATDAAGRALLLHAVRDVLVRDACCLWSDRAAVDLWLDLLASAPPGWAAPAATLLAVASYQRGDGVLALLALERALDDDPGYALAKLLDQVLALGIPPVTVVDLLRSAAEENPLTAAPTD